MAKQVNQFGYDEIVDTFVDVISAVTTFRKLFKDKFNLMSFLSWAVGNYPNIAEVVKDFGTFWEQVKDLTPEESRAAAAEIKAKVAPDQVNDKVTYVITGLALTHGFVVDSITGGKGLVDYWKNV